MATWSHHAVWGGGTITKSSSIRLQPEDKFRANKFLPKLGSKCPPIGISEYELSKLDPTEVEGVIPTIEEIEAKLGELPQDDGKD